MNNRSLDMFSESMERSRYSHSMRAPEPVEKNLKRFVDKSRSSTSTEHPRSFSQSCLSAKNSSKINSLKNTAKSPSTYYEDSLLKYYGITSRIKLERCPPSCNHGHQAMCVQGTRRRSAACVKDREYQSYSQPVGRSHTSYKKDHNIMTQSKVKNTFQEIQHYSGIPCTDDMKFKQIIKNSKLKNNDRLPYVLKLSSLVLLSGFIGALCFALTQQYIFNNGICIAPYEPTKSTDVVPADRLPNTQLIVTNLENYMKSIGEELKSIRNEISKAKAAFGGTHCIKAIQSRDVLEELFPEEPDLACAGNLGSVLATPDTTTLSTQSYFSFMGMFSMHLDWPHRQPSTVIQGMIQELGDCWAFSGEQGRLVLALHRPSLITGVSLSHIPHKISPSKNIASAPKHFSVLAHKSEDDFEHGLLLGNFEYNSNGSWRQLFRINPEIVKGELFHIVEFQFLNNQGNPDYTCVYRVHVHGVMN